MKTNTYFVPLAIVIGFVWGLIVSPKTTPETSFTEEYAILLDKCEKGWNSTLETLRDANRLLINKTNGTNNKNNRWI